MDLLYDKINNQKKPIEPQPAPLGEIVISNERLIPSILKNASKDDLLYEKINNINTNSSPKKGNDNKFFFQLNLNNTASNDVGVTLMNIDNEADTNAANTTKCSFNFSGVLNISQNTIFSINYFIGNNTGFGQLYTKTFPLLRYAGKEDVIQQLNAQGLDTFAFDGDNLVAYTTQYTYSTINLLNITTILATNTANTVSPVVITSPSQYDIIKHSLRNQTYLVKNIFISCLGFKPQMFQKMNFYVNSFTGQKNTPLTPVLDLYQRNNNLMMKMDENPLILDGYTSIQYTVLPDVNLSIIFEGEYISTLRDMDLNTNAMNPRLSKPQKFPTVERGIYIVNR